MSLSFVWKSNNFSVTEEEYHNGKYDARIKRVLTKEDYDMMWMSRDSDRTGPFENQYGKNFFKRWRTMWGSPMGVEFRPFRTADYGYPDDKMVITTSLNWILQTLGNYDILGGPKTVGLLLAAMIYNDFLPLPMPGRGASFVWNVQCGTNFVHVLSDRHSSTLAYAASGVGIFSDTWAFVKENYDNTSKIAHERHALGFALGTIVSLLL
jgi:hypothetical protein